MRMLKEPAARERAFGRTVLYDPLLESPSLLREGDSNVRLRELTDLSWDYLPSPSASDFAVASKR